MEVLFISNDYGKKGGMGHLAVNICSQLRNHGYSVRVNKFGVKPDIIITLGFVPSFTIGAHLKNKYHARLKSIICGLDVGLWSSFPRKIFLRLLKRADDLISISEYTRRQVKAWSGHDSRVVYPGTDIKKPMNRIKAKEMLYQEFGINPRKKLILAVGRLIERKGFRQLIDNAVFIEGYSLVIVGEGPDMEYMQKKKRAYGLDHVTLTGYIDDETLHALYSVADLFIMLPVYTPKDIEGFGLVYLDALSYGLPVITTRFCGFAELLDKYKAGLIIPPFRCHNLDILFGSLFGQDLGERFPLEEGFIQGDQSQLYKDMGEEALRCAGDMTWGRCVEELMHD